MKYKIGDKVRVHKDLMVGKYYNNCYFNSSMDTQRGKVVTIEEVDEPFYYIKEDGYIWTEKMFSGLAEEPRNLIPLIAKELGVEIGEEFKISNKHYVYKFTEDGLMGIQSNGTYNAPSTFFDLISGKEKIIKLPQKPKLTEAEIRKPLEDEIERLKKELLEYKGLGTVEELKEISEIKNQVIDQNSLDKRLKEIRSLDKDILLELCENQEIELYKLYKMLGYAKGIRSAPADIVWGEMLMSHLDEHKGLYKELKRLKKENKQLMKDNRLLDKLKQKLNEL